MTGRSVVRVVLVLGVAGVVAGCTSSSSSSTSPTSSTPSTSSSQVGQSGPDSAAIGLPGGFPLPSGAALVSKAVRHSKPVYALKVTSPATARAFWKRELPQQGWRVDAGASSQRIGFAGKGYGGTSAITFASGGGSKVVTVTFDRTGT